MVKKECEGSLNYYLFLGVLSSRGIYRTSFYFLFIPRVRTLCYIQHFYTFVYFSTPTVWFQRIHKIINDNINHNNNNSYSNYYPILFFFTSKNRRMVSSSNGRLCCRCGGERRGAYNIIIIPTWLCRYSVWDDVTEKKPFRDRQVSTHNAPQQTCSFNAGRMVMLRHDFCSFSLDFYFRRVLYEKNRLK